MSSTENINVEPFQINYNIYYNYCCCCCCKSTQTSNTVETDTKTDTANITTPKVFQKFFQDDNTTQSSTNNKTYRRFNAKKYLNNRQTQEKLQ